MSFWDAMNEARKDTSVVGLDFTRAAQEAQQRGPPRVFSATLLPPLLNKIGYVQLHQSNERHGRAVDAGGKVTLSQTMRPHIVHGPAPAILALKPTSLKDIAKKVNYIHEDCILFVTTIHACHRMVGTNLLVQDDNGDCLMLTLYNFVPASADPNDYFPERTHMAILAPYMKNSGDDPSKNLFLRCDNPECIRTFDTRRSWLAAKRGKKLVDTRGLDPGELRKLGNESFIEGRWEKAARLYTRAIQCPSIEREDTIACFSNLAETRLRQELWESAEESARAVVELDPEHTKALFRLATAQIHRNKLEDARQTVTNRRTKKDFQKLDRQIDRLLNEKQGHYDFARISSEAASRPGHTLSTLHSDFTSPDIEKGVEISKQNGFSYRGTIAKKAIKRRTLLSSSKALVFCSAQKSSLSHRLDPYTKSMLRGSTLQLESELIALMSRRPSIRAIVYSLASGAQDNKDRECHKIDIKRVQRIVTSNTFAASTEEEVETEWKKHKRFQQGKTLSEIEPDLEMDMDATGSGLWVNESLFNHSCTPNCTWKQVGDQMFVWTTRDVNEGEELCVTYVDIKNKSFSDRVSTFQNWTLPGVGFACQCDLCRHMRESAELREIEAKTHEAYKQAAKLVSRDGVKMAVAAEKVVSSTERQAWLNTLSKLPLRIQHFAGANLWVFEGSCRAHFDNDMQGALSAYEKAAEIKYATRGGSNMDRAKDLWRIVGASMACSNPAKAQTVLVSIYKEIFSTFHSPHIREAFRDLTLIYALPWWVDSFDEGRQGALEILIYRVISDCTGGSKSKSAKDKKSKKK